MSEKLPQSPQNDEVDLGQLFNAIGKLFERFFNFIGKIFKGIFSAIIYGLKPIVANIKLICSVIVIATILGYISDKALNEPKYESSMLVRPYFESKYQLANSIEYFNTLIKGKNIKQLSDIFEIDSISAESLISFDIEVGPETQDEILKQYNEYVNSTDIDSSMLTYLPYEVYVKKRDLLSSNLFSIKAVSFSDNVFPSLEKGITKTLTNSHSISLKEKSDAIYHFEKKNLEKQIERIDSLQSLYAEIRRKESENNEVNFNGSMFPLAEEKAITKEYELFKEEAEVRLQLKTLEEEKIENANEYYEVVSSFDAVGKKESILSRHIISFPVIAFLILILIYLINRTFKFIRDYE